MFGTFEIVRTANDPNDSNDPNEYEWASLAKTFKTGVCDYSKPLVEYARTSPSLTYSGEGKYRPLGPAPRSTAE